MDGATLFADIAKAQANAGIAAPVDNAKAEDVASWLAALGPLPSFESFPTDATKLTRWRELFGIPLSSIHAVAEIHGLNDDDLAAVLVGDWDSGTVEDAFTLAGYKRVAYGDATIFRVSGDVGDPSHPTNRAAGPAWYNVAVIDNRIFLSPSSRRLREIDDIATGDQSAPAVLDNVYLRTRLLTGRTDVTMGEIVGRERGLRTCLDRDISGITPDWQGVAAFWSGAATGGNAEIVMIPEGGRPFADIKTEFDEQVQAKRTTGEGTDAALSASLDYRGVEQSQLADGTQTLVASFGPTDAATIANYFSLSVEGCRFGAS
jgi:hypothetical protein